MKLFAQSDEFIVEGCRTFGAEKKDVRRLLRRMDRSHSKGAGSVQGSGNSRGLRGIRPSHHFGRITKVRLNPLQSPHRITLVVATLDG